MKKKIVSCFDIGEVPRSPGKWNWNWLYFLPFIFTFEQGAKGEQRTTKATLKQVNYKIDLKVTKINTQLSIRDYANRVKMA